MDDSLYVYVYIIKVISAFVVFFAVIAADVIYVGLSVTATVQFKLLGSFLEKIDVTMNINEMEHKLVQQHNFLLECVLKFKHNPLSIIYVCTGFALRSTNTFLLHS